MGMFFDLVNDNNFRLRTGMFIGSNDFIHLLFWLSGFDFARPAGELDDLHGFREWLVVKYDVSPAHPWTRVAKEKFGSLPNAREMLFMMFDDFQADVRSKGREQILLEFKEEWSRRYDED